MQLERRARLSNLRCGFSTLRRLPVRLPQLSVKARLAHSPCFAAVALQEVVTAGRTIELRAGHPLVV